MTITNFFRPSLLSTIFSVQHLKAVSLAFLAGAGLSVTSLCYGQMPSAAQIAQFQAMSPAEQRALAQSMGIDINSLGVQASSDQPDLSEPAHVQTPEIGGTHLNIDEMGEFESGELDSSELGKRVQSLPIFGLDLFKGDPNAFYPASDIPIPANYIVGPGDNIVVQLYGKENNAFGLTINREGQIQFPNIGPITLAGLTFQQAQDVIATTVQERKVGVRASTTMGALRTIRVFVLGEVKRPGSFTVGALATMTNALFASGGISDVGSLRKVQLKRNGQLVTELDLYNLLLRGDTSNDSRLLPGDVIFVPPVGNTAEISGGVQRPARYELKNQGNLAQLVKLAGGLTNTAHPAKIAITRVNDSGERSLYNADLNSAKGRAFKIINGDHVVISDALEHVNNQITVHGSAKRPGGYSWRQGIRFSEVIQGPTDLSLGADMNIALLQRMSAKTGRIHTQIFSPSKAWREPNSSENPVLQDYDEIFLFDFVEERSEALENVIALLQQQAQFNEREQTVNITGSVRFPGLYPLAKGMDTQALIELAGGLTESAYSANGEITRYQISENEQRMVGHLTINLQEAPVDLEPGDTLNVKQVPLWKKRETVEIKGEVMFPGIYTITPGETLMDVFIRAGGITPYAHTKGAVFSRAELRALEQQRLDELKTRLEEELAVAAAEATLGKKDLDADEEEALLEKLEATAALGRMVIDLQRIMDEPATHDFPLEDGDVLTIPRFKPSVTVVGEVQYPTSHFFNKRLDASDYIQQSGGMKKHADGRRVYIVKANGRVIEPSKSKWFKAKKERMEPGDTIVVPLNTDHVNSLEIWSTTTQILYQAALGVAAIGRL